MLIFSDKIVPRHTGCGVLA